MHHKDPCLARRTLTIVLLIALFVLSFGTFAPSAARQNKTRLVFSNWHLGEAQWAPAISKAIADFNAQNQDIEVVPEIVKYAERDTRYLGEMKDGGGPDIIKIHHNSFRRFIESGHLADLTPLIAAEGPDFLKPWYSPTLDMVKFKDHYYLMPGDFQTMILAYNRQLFTEAGLDPDKPPKTWTELLDYAKKLTRDSNKDGRVDTWGIGVIGADNPGFELRFTPFLFSFGGRYLNAEESCSALNSPEALAGFKFFTDLVTVHKVVPPGVTSADPGAVRQNFANRQIAMKITAGWLLPIVQGLKKDADWSKAIQAAEIPVPESRDTKITTTAWLSGYAINKNTKNPAAAWRFIKFLTSKQQEQTWFDLARVTSPRMDVTGLGGTGGYAPLVNDPIAKAMVALMPKAEFVPQIAEWPEASHIVNLAARDVFSGVSTAEQALEKAHNQINQLLSKRRGDKQICPAWR